LGNRFDDDWRHGVRRKRRFEPLAEAREDGVRSSRSPCIKQVTPRWRLARSVHEFQEVG